MAGAGGKNRLFSFGTAYILFLAEECDRLYEHGFNEGYTEIVTAGETPNALAGISTILVKAGCSIETFVSANFGGRSWSWTAENGNDEIYNTDQYDTDQ